VVARDGKFEGPYRTYYESGDTWEKGTYKNGDLEGDYKIFNEFGTVSEEGIYLKGKLNGEVRISGDNGKFDYVDTYKDGKRIKRVSERTIISRITEVIKKMADLEEVFREFISEVLYSALQA